MVGLSRDRDAEAAVAAPRLQQIPWPTAVIPRDTQSGKLWFEASRLRSQPMLLLIDQQGVYRAKLTLLAELEPEITALIEK